ncbi:MAG: hypothetical protein HZB56_11440 [Deltaproteobacteria bacterium]|nr:hypothetical protein [Deltaproteobacteria bacterium]
MAARAIGTLLALAALAGGRAGAGEAAPEPAPPAPSAGCQVLDLGLAGLGSWQEELARTAGLTGNAAVRPGLLRRASGARPLSLCLGPVPEREAVADPAPEEVPRWDLVPPTSFSTFHYNWSDDRNDGALFGGKGLSTQVSTGLRLRWWRLTAQAAPSLAWQQNRFFVVPPAPAPWSPYANPFNVDIIDLPLRMGPGSFWTPDPGQSFVRIDGGAFAAGISTENLWWGPGLRNSLLLTNSAPGFPHLFVGTTRPVDVYLGWLEMDAVWGQVRDSKWLHADGHVERRLITATGLTFAPRFEPNLTLGMGRVVVFPETTVNFDRAISALLPPVLQLADLRFRSHDVDNQVSVIFLRWAFPRVQFELYGEWGRDDWPAGVLAGIQEPGYSQAFAFGLGKLFPSRHGWFRFRAEMTHTFEMPPVHPEHQTATFYTHSDGTGMTNAGQMLGAGLGPQGDTQYVAVDWFHPAGRLGLFVERVLRNERYYYDVMTSIRRGIRHDVAMTYGASATWSRGEWDVSAEAGFTDRFNANFSNGHTGTDARLTVRWWPGRRDAPVLPPPSPAAR